MLTAILVLNALLPTPAPLPVGTPGIVLAAPAWALAALPVAAEPTLPCLPAWVDWVEEERAASLMAGVMPFAAEDAADPFDESATTTKTERR